MPWEFITGAMAFPVAVSGRPDVAARPLTPGSGPPYGLSGEPFNVRYAEPG